MRKKLSLYVWEGVLCDYTCGAMFALAHDAEEARRVILAKENSSSIKEGLGGEPEVITKPEGFLVWGGG